MCWFWCRPLFFINVLFLVQDRVVHNSSAEWQSIKDAAERARNRASVEVDDVGTTTCTELLEALELSRCLLLMG